MQRILLGTIAAGLFLIGLCAELNWWQGDTAKQLGGPLLRVGILLGAVCLALPQLQRLPPWLPLVGLVLGVIVAYRPRLIVFAVPLLIVLWFLRPRTSRSSAPLNRSPRR